VTLKGSNMNNLACNAGRDCAPQFRTLEEFNKKQSMSKKVKAVTL